MRRYFYSLFAGAVLLLAAGSASAQMGSLRGRVFIQQADGTKVPAAGAQHADESGAANHNQRGAGDVASAGG